MKEKKVRNLLKMIFGFVSPEEVNKGLRSAKPHAITFFRTQIERDHEEIPEGQRASTRIFPGKNKEGRPTLYAVQELIDNEMNVVKTGNWYDLGEEFDKFDFAEFLKRSTQKPSKNELPPASSRDDENK